MKRITKEFKALIKKILTEAPRASDDDAYLWAVVIDLQRKIIREQTYRGIEILSLISAGKLPSFDTITRCRRKLQEDNENLRGKTFKARQRHAKTFKKEEKKLFQDRLF